MPTYVYACKGCEERTELQQRISDEPLKECPKCGDSVRRVLFPPAVVYKGSGFYTTDYKNGSSGSSSSASKPAESKASESSSSSETKTETKSETKSETTSTAK
ncbi:MAG: FmdB family zinc ribbon protein [Armatimonadota bacterium]